MPGGQGEPAQSPLGDRSPRAPRPIGCATGRARQRTTDAGGVPPPGESHLPRPSMTPTHPYTQEAPAAPPHNSRGTAGANLVRILLLLRYTRGREGVARANPLSASGPGACVGTASDTSTRPRWQSWLCALHQRCQPAPHACCAYTGALREPTRSSMGFATTAGSLGLPSGTRYSPARNNSAARWCTKVGSATTLSTDTPCTPLGS